MTPLAGFVRTSSLVVALLPVDTDIKAAFENFTEEDDHGLRRWQARAAAARRIGGSMGDR